MEQIKEQKKDCVHYGFAMGEREEEPICPHCSPKKITEQKDFKINDLVEVTKWKKAKDRRNWIITGFAGLGAEAVLCQIPTGTQAIIMLTDLKLQKRKIERMKK